MNCVVDHLVTGAGHIAALDPLTGGKGKRKKILNLENCQSYRNFLRFNLLITSNARTRLENSEFFQSGSIGMH